MDHGWSSTSLLIAMLVSIIGAWSIVMRMMGSRRRPPGPRGLPIIGHLHLLGKLPHQALSDLSKVHGPLMSLRLGSIPILVASSPDMARQILKERDQAFLYRRSTVAGNHIFGGSKGMLFSSATTPHWKLIRRTAASELFSPKQLNHFQPLRLYAARALMRSILADCNITDHQITTTSTSPPAASVGPPPGGLCHLRPKIMQALSNLITQMMTGQTLTELAGDKAASIVQLSEEVPKLLGAFNVSDYLPFLAWMDLQGCERRSKEVATKMREVFDPILQARLQAGIKKEDALFLDVLLQSPSSSTVMNHFLEFVVGGTDTCASAIEWALAELIKNPEKMSLLQAEIEQVVGKARMVEEGDIAHLPYLVACVKETMRLHPVGPLLAPHETNAPCEILNFQIPPKTRAFVNLWAIGRDPLVWENPLQFLPERFLKSNPIDMQGQHFELITFGTGRRICPGLRVALPTTSLILASLIQGFEWSPSSSEQIDMAEHFGIVMSMKTPLIAYTRPRLPKDLYTLP